VEQVAAVLFVLLLLADLIWLRVLWLLWRGVVKWPLVGTDEEREVSGLGEPSEAPLVLVFIPARNEAAHVENALRSVLAQDYSNFIIRFIDDQSTDNTLAIAKRLAEESHRLEVFEGKNRPPGWLGKPWALYQLTQGARADWFLFVDADIVLHPRALSQAMDKARHYQADLFSFGVNVELESFWQRVVGISTAIITAAVVPVVHVNDPRKSAAFAAGGFMLFRRDAYFAIGGHEAVKDEMIEDVVLARRVKAHALRLILLSAPELAKTHYYGTLRDIWRAARKSAHAFSGFGLGGLIAYTALLFLSAFVPWIGLLSGLFGGAGGFDSGWWIIVACSLPSVLSMVVLSGGFASLTHSSLCYAFCFPLGALFIWANTCDSAWRYRFGSGIEWKGRNITS
jgi:chlorobactene glucosyltransferase